MNRFIYILILSITIISCDDAVFNAGDIVTKEIEISYFKEIHVDDIFEIYLTQSDECKVEAKGGCNLLPNLEFKVDENKKLTISDNNKVRWSRDYDKIELYISVDTLNFLRLNEPCKVITQNSLTTINFSIWSIADYAEYDINLGGVNFYFVNSGTSGGILNLDGEITNFSFWARASFKVNAKNLIADHVTVKTESIGDCNVYVNEQLSVEILRDGKVYYEGSPEIIEYVNEKAREQLIKLD